MRLVWLGFLILAPGIAAADDDWYAKLSRGYAGDDTQPLTAFLNQWQAKVTPIPDDLVAKKPDIEKAVYGLYKSFFEPDARFYKDKSYLLIENRMHLFLVDSDLKREFTLPDDERDAILWNARKISHIEIEDFRPQLQIKDKKVLYLDDEHLYTVLRFLAEGKELLTIDQYYSEDCTSAERVKRLRYLQSALQIFPGHWGKGWIVAAQPSTGGIYLSSDLRRAVVRYRIRYSGGYALMQRNSDGQWEKLTMKQTWIE